MAPRLVLAPSAASRPAAVRRRWRRVGVRAATLLAGTLGLGCGGDAGTGAPAGGAVAEPVRLSIGEVVFQVDGTPTVLLVTPDSQALLVPVSDCEGYNIYTRLHGMAAARPLTPDLFAAAAESLDVQVERVELDAAAGGRPGPPAATLTLRGSAGRRQVPASAGDALAIAQRAGAPILGTAALVAAYAVQPGVTGKHAWPVAEVPSSLPAARPAGPLCQALPEQVEMRVLDVTLTTGLRLVLIDAAESVALSFAIGICEGSVIHARLHGESLAAIPPQEVLVELLAAGGAQMDHAGMLRVEGGVFIGEVGLQGRDRRMCVDARPSDAIALALFTGAPVYVAGELLAAYGEDPASYGWLLDR